MNFNDSSSRYRSDKAKNLVGFLVGHVIYAVEIEKVQEIVNPLSFVALPHAPLEVVGVAERRGQLLPVVDLRVRFGLEPLPATRRTKWLIVGMDQRSVAFVVDAVTEVFGAGEPEQREVPSLGGGEEARGIAAVYLHQERLVFVVDPEQVAAGATQLKMSLAALEGLERGDGT